MTLSKKQVGIIWGTVVIVVLLLGLVTSESRVKASAYWVSVYTETRLYGIEIFRQYSGQIYQSPKTPEIIRERLVPKNFFYTLSKNKTNAIIALIIIGLALFLTIKKK